MIYMILSSDASPCGEGAVMADKSVLSPQEHLLTKSKRNYSHIDKEDLSCIQNAKLPQRRI